MRAGRGDLKRPFGRGLAPDVGEIAVVRPPLGHERGQVDDGGRQIEVAGQVVADLGQRAGPADREALDDSRLGHVLCRKDQALATRGAGGEGHRQRPADRAHVAFEPDLADQHETGEARVRELAAGDEDADRNGQIEPGAGLVDVGRGQVDRDALEGQRETRIGERRVDPLPAFPDGAVGQADRSERRQAAADVHLDVHGIRVDAEDRGGTNDGKHAGNLARVPKAYRSTPAAAASCARRPDH